MDIGLFDHSATQEFMNFNGVGRKVLKAYMRLIAKKVEHAIAQDLPAKFGIVFDQWAIEKQHYLSVFAVYLKQQQVKEVLLATSRLYSQEEILPDDEADDAKVSHCATQFVEYIKFELETFGKTIGNIVWLVASNSAVSKHMAKVTGLPFVGCAAHRFNTAVHAMIQEEYKDDVAAVHKLMRALTGLNFIYPLRRLTDFRPLLHHPNRWPSTYDMLQRYFELMPALIQMPPDLQRMIPSNDQGMNLDELYEDFKWLSAVPTFLAGSKATMATVRRVFDKVIHRYPSMKNFLAPDSPIVPSTEFESALVRLQRTESLTPEEAQTLAPFKKNVKVKSQRTTERTASWVDLLLSGGAKESDQEQYDATIHVIPPASNAVERFMVRQGKELRDLVPRSLALVLFLKVNRSLWSLNLVDQVVESTNIAEHVVDGDSSDEE
ncbi:Aste57867_703 [Aphanomyces stellatus]|uniref:Aste57867_703 protein n=1 Tax=Aphanomyces stellatus TaxID=120398 RepID=A0A485K7E3_9STRA|nr:hypothetical protein As57867_000702 [Aphanomyces stellatus]VFT77927.1 Aste57867_703 [Aphanomyces stellatus]